MRRLTWTSALILSLGGCSKDPDVDEAGETTSPETGDETGDEVCEGFDDETLESPLQVAITNPRSEPVYLMTLASCTFDYVHIVGDAGHWPSGSCEPTCTAILDGLCACSEPCAAPQLLRIEPGGSYTLDWAYVLAANSVPEACVDTNVCGFGPCSQSIAPPDGGYVISVDVLLTPVECEGPEDPCACEADQESCPTSVSYQGPADLELDVEVELPGGSLEVELPLP